MTRRCPRCGSENLPEAKFCENCGTNLDAEVALSEAPSDDDGPRPGSLRDAIPFLTGGVDQAKARFDGWKQKKTRSETEKLREQHFEKERQSATDEDQGAKKESFQGTVARIMVGLLAIALLIYLLIRHPNIPHHVARGMVGRVLAENGF